MKDAPEKSASRSPLASAGVNFSEHFIRRPIATSLLMVGFAVFGVMAYKALPVSDLPNVDFPTLTVSASLPGADPGTMASAVATPLERQFTTIAGWESAPVGNLLFAGEHTNSFYEWQGFMEGALLSGIDAAAQILKPKR